MFEKIMKFVFSGLFLFKKRELKIFLSVLFIRLGFLIFILYGMLLF